MDEQQRAFAHSRAYTLFAQVYTQGLDAEIVALFNSISPIGSDQHLNYMAEHYRLFGHNVFAYESIFLGTNGLLGGAITESVQMFYHEVGFAAPDNESADHIGVELSLMAFLCAAESDALEDKLPHQAQRMRQLQRRFLDDHLLRWLPACVCAIQQQGQSIHSQITLQSLNLVLEHRQQLGDDLMMQTVPFTLADAPNLISTEKTSLRDIATYWLIPVYTGFYLSTDDIKRIGSRFHMPHGFGKRHQILLNLFHSASDYGMFVDVLDVLGEFAQRWLDYYEGLELPQGMKVPWMSRLSHSTKLLAELRQLALQQQFEPDTLTAADVLTPCEATSGCAVEKDSTHDNSY